MYELKGHYEAEIHENGRATFRSFSNLITQQGKDAFADTALHNLLRTAKVGVGGTPASDEQTKLFAEVGSPAQASTLTVGGVHGDETITVEYIFPEGTFDNVDLSEVGVFTTSGLMFSRALFKDEVGNTIPINVQKTQRLVLRYTLNTTYSTNEVRENLVVAGKTGLTGVRVIPLTRRYAQNTPTTAHEFAPHPASCQQVQVVLVSDPLFDGPSYPAANNDKELLLNAFLPSPYSPGSRVRQVSIKIDSQYGNKGTKGLLITHPVLGTVACLVFDSVVTKNPDFRLFFDFEFDWS